jgi:hypothetical protein
MVRDILAAAIDAQSDMVVVDTSDADAVDAGPGAEPDVVIMDDDGSLCEAVVQIGARHALVALCGDCRIAVLCKLNPGETIIREMSAAMLVESIREVTRSA